MEDWKVDPEVDPITQGSRQILAGKKLKECLIFCKLSSFAAFVTYREAFLSTSRQNPDNLPVRNSWTS